MILFMKHPILFAVIPLLLLASCGKSNATNYEFPSVKKDTTSAANKPCIIWVDQPANFADFANSQSNIARDLKKAADAGFTHVVVDVRNVDGDVLYKSEHCDPVRWQSAYVNGIYTKTERTADFDYLQTFIDEGHKLGLKVYAGFDTFVAGNRNSSFGEHGAAYRDPEIAAEATYWNTDKGMVPVMEVPGQYEVFLNPTSQKAQEYVITLLKDLAAYSATGLDGIVLDRARFMGIQADFSPTSREQFEEYVGDHSIKWPDDIMPTGFSEQVTPASTRYYLKWLEFRVKTIYDFMGKAAAAVKEVAPDLRFGAYVGAWYAMYTENGVNWASQKYDPYSVASFRWFASPNYKDYGYAALLDFLIVGAYAQAEAVYGTDEWTMQGFCSLAYDKVRGDCPVYGGPDVGNWDPEGRYDESLEQQSIVNSVKACGDACNGYFLFDMIHLKTENEWQYAKRGIDLFRAGK